MCTKHVNEAVFATELLGMLRARRIDIDQAAAAYCWEDKLNLAKRPALTQLVKELVIYMQELQDQYNQSNNIPAEKHSEEKQQPGEDTSKQNNPAPSIQTNIAPDTAHIDSHAAPRPTTPRRNTGADTRSPRTPPPNVHPVQALSDNTPTNTARGTKRSHSPTVHTGLPIKDKSQDHIHMIDSPLSQHNAAPDTTQLQAASTTATHFPGRSLAGAKKQRQSKLVPDAKRTTTHPKMDTQRIFQQPTQPTPWFQSHFTRVHTESGITRWYGALKGISEKQRKQCKQCLDMVSEDFPTITTSQQEALQKAAVAWGLPFKSIEKFSDQALVKIIAIITQMTE